VPPYTTALNLLDGPSVSEFLDVRSCAEVEAASVWTGLVAAGSELGVAFVGADALDRLALARDGALLHA